jgi:predicted transcriptional regulator
MAAHITSIQQERLEHLAERTTLTPDQLLQEEVDRFLDHEEEMLRAIKQGDEDIAADRLLDHADVVARIDHLIESL